MLHIKYTGDPYYRFRGRLTNPYFTEKWVSADNESVSPNHLQVVLYFLYL